MILWMNEVMSFCKVFSLCVCVGALLWQCVSCQGWDVQQTKDVQSTVREGFVRDMMLQNDWCVSQSRPHKLVIHCVPLIQT